MAVPSASGGDPKSLEELIASEAILPLYQPIMDLRTRRVVAFEALARGPKGSAFATPDQIFGAVESVEQLRRLDALCQRRAFEGALEYGLGSKVALFVNIEPAALSTEGPHVARDREAAAGLRVVAEITERSLTADPSALMTFVRQARERGWGLALDDVGADTRSLALLPLLQPDVIKLDLRLVQQHPNREIVAIIAAVNAHAERHGAVVLAEGIETEAQLRTALSMGATLGQGWLLGRPGGFADVEKVIDADHIIAICEQWRVPSSPFEIARSARSLNVSTKPLLMQMSRHVEDQAIGIGDPAVVLATFQHQKFYRSEEAIRYEQIARQASFVGVMAEGLTDSAARDVRQADLAPNDVLRHEWDVVALGPHFAAALIARDLGYDAPEEERLFEFIMTYDRSLVIQAGQALMSRFRSERG